MINKTMDSPTRKGRPKWPHLSWRWLLAAVVAGLALWIWVQLAAAPGSVKSVSIKNDTDYTLSIAVAGPGAENWMDLGFATHNRVTVFEQVVDQGKTWTFRTRAQGQDGGQFAVSRSDLAAGKWTFAVPASVSAQLRTAGVTPDPKTG